MKNRALHGLLVAGLFHLALTGSAGAVEIFRIGGEDEPRPDQPGVIFHQLSWSDFAEQAGLDEEALARGILRPIYLDPDENIALTSVARGGGPWVRVTGESRGVTEHSKTMVDGDPETFYEWYEVSIQEKYITQRFLQPHQINVDLGGQFNINRVRIIAPADGSFSDRLDLAINPERETRGVGLFRGASAVLTYDIASQLFGEVVFRLPENVQDTIDVHFPTAPAWTVLTLLYRTSPKALKVTEIEVYGEGYINQASYLSPLLDLGEPAIWGNIRWRGQQDPQAKVWIQSRAGKDLDPNVYWRFTGRGDEVSRSDEKGKALDAAAYGRLKPGEEAGITYDTENWSFWSPPYEFADSSGTFVLSPGPNSIFQLQVDFLPSFRNGGEVEFIEFSATKPPLVEDVVGEIYPVEVPLGEIAQFTYALEPTIRTQHTGFDRIEISTPFGLVGVDTVKISRVPVEFTAQIERPDSTLFSVQLPRHLEASDSEELIEVVFRAPVLRYGTPFDGWVRDTARPLELPQRVNPGDASDEFPSEGLMVRTVLSERLLGALQVEPRVVTPNGDGTNERVDFSFNLLQLTDEVPLRLEIFDLSGRLVWARREDLPESGHFSFSWDGRDGHGGVVPPGLYVYRLAVEAERGDDQQSGTLAVVY